MKSPPPSNDRRRMTLDEFTRDLARRREELGPIEVPRNSGAHRTESKKALLRALAELGAKW